jgi:hypothetical protein
MQISQILMPQQMLQALIPLVIQAKPQILVI